MKAEYWFKRWREGRTRWHQDTVMPLLVRHWPTLNVPRHTLVLVPFCGKSLDMIWLAEQEYRVLGVEISPLGIEQFFAENNLQANTHETPDGLRYSAGNIEIIQGNLFDVTAAMLAGCNAIYDRAALIAQPASERQRYADAVYAKLPVSCRGLLITLDYPQAEMDGPPFSVDEREVRRLFGTRWDITRIERRDILADEPHFQEAGLSSLHTAVYRLRRRAD